MNLGGAIANQADSYRANAPAPIGRSLMKSRRVAGRIASAPAYRCRLDNTPDTAPGLPIRRERAAGYWPQVPGECEERISASVAPEHLRGAWRLSSDEIAAPDVTNPYADTVGDLLDSRRVDPVD